LHVESNQLIKPTDTDDMPMFCFRVRKLSRVYICLFKFQIHKYGNALL